MQFLPSIVLVIVFILTWRYRKPLARAILTITAPILLLYLFTTAVLIFFEENVNCQPWCGTTIIPPTLLFLLFESLVIYFLVRIARTRSVLIPTIAYAAFGIIWETSIGVARDQLAQLLQQSPFGYFLTLALVAISYAFVVVLPLTIVQLAPEKRGAR